MSSRGKKDTIIAGGFNIYPREVEEVLYEHEAIQEVVVAGILTLIEERPSRPMSS